MNEDLIITKLVELGEAVGKLASNGRVDHLERQILDHFDEQMTILLRLDQERLFTIERVKRLEVDVERIKLRLQIA